LGSRRNAMVFKRAGLQRPCSTGQAGVHPPMLHGAGRRAPGRLHGNVGAPMSLPLAQPTIDRQARDGLDTKSLHSAETAAPRECSLHWH
jgi:hypothetical protein